jgi:hypothetical protein
MKLYRCFFPGLFLMASTCMMAQNLISNPGLEEPPVVQVSKATKKSDTAQSSPHLPNSLDQVKITFPGWSVLMPRIKDEFNVPIFWDLYDFELIKKWYTETIDAYNAYPMLDQLAGYLTRNQNAKIDIHGHTDNIGDAASNKKLSLARAEAVRSYLISKGVDGTRIKTVGHGSTIPKASNNTEEGRRQNARVEIEFR